MLDETIDDGQTTNYRERINNRTMRLIVRGSSRLSRKLLCKNDGEIIVLESRTTAADDGSNLQCVCVCGFGKVKQFGRATL